MIAIDQGLHERFKQTAVPPPNVKRTPPVWDTASVGLKFVGHERG